MASEKVMFAIHPDYSDKPERVRFPTRGTPDAAGLDIFLDYPPEMGADIITLEPNKHYAIPTGLAVSVPAGHFGLLVVRSSTFRDIHAHGVIDSDFRGHLTAIFKTGSDGATFPRTKPLLQMVIVKYATTFPLRADYADFTVTARGENGFGSTDRKL